MPRILVLEDDETFGNLVKSCLEDQGHAVALFLNATDALADIQDNPVDLIIADLFMRRNETMEAGGIKLISSIRQIHRDTTPIIAMSGAFGAINAIHSKSTARTVGANAVLAKPFRPDDLLALANRLLAEAPRKNTKGY